MQHDCVAAGTPPCNVNSSLIVACAPHAEIPAQAKRKLLTIALVIVLTITYEISQGAGYTTKRMTCVFVSLLLKME